LFTLTVNAQEKAGTPKETKKPKQGYGYLNVESDSIGDPVQRITTYRDGSVYKIKVVNEKITALSIDGKEIPERDFPQYEAMVKKILEQVKRDQEQAEKDRAQAELDRQQASRDRVRAELDRQQAEKDRQQAEKNRAQAALDRQQAEKDRIQADKDRQQAELDRKQAEKDRAQAEIDRKQAAEDRKLVAALIDDLVKEKIIASKEALVSLELSESGLIVNDQKQPDALFQQFKAKYLKKPGMHFNFYHKGNIRQFNIGQER